MVAGIDKVQSNDIALELSCIRGFQCNCGIVERSARTCLAVVYVDSRSQRSVAHHALSCPSAVKCDKVPIGVWNIQLQ